MKRFIAWSMISALFAAGGAFAADYVVARSTVASIAKGTQYAAGDTVPLPVGQSATLISSGGEVVVLQGAAGGARLPALAKGPQTASMAALSALVNRPAPRRNFGAMRGKAGCPEISTLKTLDAILAAGAIDGCAPLAREALESYINAGSTAAGSTPATR